VYGSNDKIDESEGYKDSGGSIGRFDIKDGTREKPMLASLSNLYSELDEILGKC